MNAIAIYGSHDTSICFRKDGKYRILELEKFTGKRNCCLAKRIDFIASKPTDQEYLDYLYHAKSQIPEPIDCIYYNQLFKEDFAIINPILRPSHWEKFDHHLAHAACSFYQSPFEEALVVTFDGGGEPLKGPTDFFNFYHASKNTGIKLIKKLQLDLCCPYYTIAYPIKEINKGVNILPFAGKLMGFSSYGQRDELLEPELENYFRGFLQTTVNRFNKMDTDSIEGTQAKNLAFTAQKVFEKLFEEALSSVDNSLPICLSGGGALNVLNNQRIYELTQGKVFIPPNPNDCGLAFGALVNHDQPKSQVKLLFNGYDFLDTLLSAQTNQSYWLRDVIAGKIVGVIRGQGEIGPRALGNRSIFCNPAIRSMKETLNNKVKFREWFRPFAPVVREEDVSKFFHFNQPAKFMEFCPKIRDEYRSQLQSVVHVDGTCRVQTVNHADNPWLHETFTRMETIGALPVLLNTSFNIKGGAIINRISDAQKILLSTELDGILINDSYIKK